MFDHIQNSWLTAVSFSERWEQSWEDFIEKIWELFTHDSLTNFIVMAKHSQACNCLSLNYHFWHRLISLYLETHRHVGNDSLIEIHEKKYPRPQDVAICWVYYRIPELFWGPFLDKFLYVLIIYCGEIKVLPRSYIFSDLDNTWVIMVFINNFGKTSTRLKIFWDIIFKTDIHDHIWEESIKDVTNFTLIGNDFFTFFQYDIIIRRLFRGKKRLDGFPKLLIFLRLLHSVH